MSLLGRVLCICFIGIAAVLLAIPAHAQLTPGAPPLPGGKPTSALPLCNIGGQFLTCGVPLSSLAEASAQGAMNINGDFNIDQTHAGTAFTDTATFNTPAHPPLLDRWFGSYPSSWPFTSQQETSNVPTGSAYALQLTLNTVKTIGTGQAYAADTYISPANFQGLGWGTSTPASLDTDICMWSNTVGAPFAWFIKNSGKSESYIGSFTVQQANVWQCQAYSVPGPTAGTWAISGTASVIFGIDLGTDQTSAIGQGNLGWNTAAANSAPSSFSGAMQLVTNSGAIVAFAAIHIRPLAVTGIPYTARPYAQELSLARQWIQTSVTAGVVPKANLTSGGTVLTGYQGTVAAPALGGTLNIKLDPPMYGPPAIAIYNPFNTNANTFWDQTAAADVDMTVDPGSTAGSTNFTLYAAPAGAATDNVVGHYLAISSID